MNTENNTAPRQHRVAPGAGDAITTNPERRPTLADVLISQHPELAQYMPRATIEEQARSFAVRLLSDARLQEMGAL